MSAGHHPLGRAKHVREAVRRQERAMAELERRREQRLAELERQRPDGRAASEEVDR